MKRLILPLLLSVGLTTRAEAQAAAVRGGALTEERVAPATEALYEQLFRGIPVTKDQEARARGTIRDMFMVLAKMPPGAMSIDTIVRLVDRRDSTLVSLLQNPDDKRTVAARAATIHPRPKPR